MDGLLKKKYRSSMENQKKGIEFLNESAIIDAMEAQLSWDERSPHTREVTGSSPVASTGEYREIGALFCVMENTVSGIFS